MLLSCRNPNYMVGNYLADILTNKELVGLPFEVLEGVRLHRSIDSFTDNHPKVLESLLLIYPSQRKYASVVLDIFYDYLLTKHWDKFSLMSMRLFVDNTYEVLLSHQFLYASKTLDLLNRMINDDFLYSCSNLERLEKTYQRIASRAKFENQMSEAGPTMINLIPELEEGFLSFFHDLIKHVDDFCEC